MNSDPPLLATLNAACDSVDRLGEVTGARLLAEVGDDRDRFADARAFKPMRDQLQSPAPPAAATLSCTAASRMTALATVGYSWAFIDMTNCSTPRPTTDDAKLPATGYAAALRHLFNKMLG